MFCCLVDYGSTLTVTCLRIDLFATQCVIPGEGAPKEFGECIYDMALAIQGGAEKNGTVYFPQYVDAITDISVLGNFS